MGIQLKYSLLPDYKKRVGNVLAFYNENGYELGQRDCFTFGFESLWVAMTGFPCDEILQILRPYSSKQEAIQKYLKWCDGDMMKFKTTLEGLGVKVSQKPTNNTIFLNTFAISTGILINDFIYSIAPGGMCRMPVEYASGYYLTLKEEK